MKKTLALLFVLFSCFAASEVMGQSIAVMQARVNIVSGSQAAFLGEVEEKDETCRLVITSTPAAEIIAKINIKDDEQIIPVAAVALASKHGDYHLDVDAATEIDLHQEDFRLSVHYL